MTTKTLAGALAIGATLMSVGVPTAHADYLFIPCPSGRSGIATLVTSCPFADNVRASYFASPSALVDAYSPVTGQEYSMWCDSHTVVTLNNIGTRLGVRCDGGTNAVVVFW